MFIEYFDEKILKLSTGEILEYSDKYGSNFYKGIISDFFEQIIQQIRKINPLDEDEEGEVEL